MIRSRSAVHVLLLLAPACCTAEVVRDGDLRVVRVRACADEELRERSEWRQEIIDHLAFASNIYQRTFGIRLDVTEVVEWKSDDALALDDLVDRLEKEISADDVDVVIGFSAQKPHRGKISKYVSLPWGLTPSLGRVSIIRALIDDESYDLHLALIHEIAHLFGAFHVPRQDSVMRVTLDGPRTFQFDVENGKLLRLLRDYDFEQGVEEIEPLIADRITALWRRATTGDDRNPLAEALYNRGIDLMNEGRLGEAVALWERAARADDAFAEPRGLAGMALADLGRPRDALRLLRAAARLGWADATAMIALVEFQEATANKKNAGAPVLKKTL